MKRIKELDLMRGIAILLVVLGHTLPPVIKDNYIFAYLIYHFIYNFHMPLFFLLSGFLFYLRGQDYLLKRIVISKFKQLMIPYLSYSILIYLFINFLIRFSERLAKILNENGYETSNSIYEIVYNILTYNNHMDKHIWFVYALFIIFILATIIETISSNYGIKNHYILIVFLLISFFVSLDILPIIKIIELSLYNFVFFYAGKLFVNIYKKKFLLLKYSTSIITLFLIFNLITIFFHYWTINHYIYKGIGEIIHQLLIYPTSILGIFSVYIICNKIQKIELVKKLLLLSDYSYDIYLIHQPFIVSGCIALTYILLNVPVVISVILALTFGIIVPIIISKYIIRRNNLLGFILLGRQLTKRSV
ncbi:acyltransferase [Niallia circulans]|uniref:acyltransferase n=1 Tax=Niallia circulans TaxID=1397 RepID=UPI002E2431BE|nr:acyltransferase [Niallia circulans]